MKRSPFSPENLVFDSDSVPSPMTVVESAAKVVSLRPKLSDWYVRSKPLVWSQKAVKRSFTASVVGEVLWLHAGLRKSTTFKLQPKLFRGFGLSRYVVSRGLMLLEQAELIRVQRESGKAPTVTIIDA
jgi:hypothetical protein